MSELEHTNDNNRNNSTEASFPNSADSHPKWDEDSMAQLLGLRERNLDSPNSEPKLPAPDSKEFSNVSSESSEMGFEGGNVISQAELFEDEAEDANPHNVKTKPTLSSNPLAKFGLVGLGTFAIFLAGGLFLHNVMKTKIQPSPTAQQQTSPSTQNREQNDAESSEIGNLKTQLALGKQEEQLAALNRSKSPKNREPIKFKEQTTEKPAPTQPTPNNTSTTSARVPPPSASPPRVVTRYITRRVPVPTPVVTRPASTSVAPTPTRSLAPVLRNPASTPVVPTATRSPAPVVTRPTFTPAAPPPKLVPIPTPQPQPQERHREPEKPAPIDPMKQWMALQKLGSYGEVSPENSEEKSVVTNKNEQAVTATSVNSQPEITRTPNQGVGAVATVPRATPVLRTNGSNSPTESIFSSEKASILAGMPSENSSNEEQNILTRIPSGNLSNEEQNILTRSTSENLSNREQNILTRSTSENLSNEEQNILTGTPLVEVKNLMVGQQAEAVLVTPVISSIDPARNSNGVQIAARQSNLLPDSNTNAERFVVRLNQPLVDSSGQVLLPSGTLAVFEVNSVHPSGLVDFNSVALIVNGQEYRLPPGVISIRGEDGNPLMAQKYDDKGPEIAGMDASTVIFGSLANVGRVLNQPKDEEYEDFDSAFSSRRRTRINRGDPNLLGAVLEGGFTPLLQQIQRRNEQAIAQIQSRPNLWYITPNKKVVVFVNRSFDL